MIREKISEKVLELAIKALSRFDKGEHLDVILDTFRDRIEGKIVADILFNYFRHRGVIDYSIYRATSKKVNGKKVNRKTPRKFFSILIVAITQAKFQDGIEEYVAVDVAVHYAKKKYGKSVSGFINATLRGILSEDFALILEDAPENVKLNLPKQVLSRWKKSFSKEEIAEFAKVFSKKAPLMFRLIEPIPHEELVRINCRRIKMPKWGDEYTFYESLDAKLLFQQNWLEKGHIYIQDLSTISPCLFYKPSSNDVVYDLCSAPGGKSLLLRDRAIAGVLIAADQSFVRQKRTTQNLETQNSYYNKEGVLNLEKNSVDAFVIVASAFSSPFLEESGNCVFLDVPCSNSGVIRRRPDAIWNFSEKKIRELVNIQKKILRNSEKLVKPGGVLIYSTCSIEEEENGKQVELFLSNNPNFKLEEERQLYPTLTNDGGYAARLRKE
jgi:16S rRNA (cytosine967-C5)-methyltransferase